jgi:hypothetical protein
MASRRTRLELTRSRSAREVNNRYVERELSEGVRDGKMCRMVPIGREGRLILENRDQRCVVRSLGRLTEIAAAVEADDSGDPLWEPSQISEQCVELAMPSRLHGEEHNMMEHGISLRGPTRATSVPSRRRGRA